MGECNSHLSAPKAFINVAPTHPDMQPAFAPVRQNWRHDAAHLGKRKRSDDACSPPPVLSFAEQVAIIPTSHVRQLDRVIADVLRAVPEVSYRPYNDGDVLVPLYSDMPNTFLTCKAALTGLFVQDEGVFWEKHRTRFAYQNNSRFDDWPCGSGEVGPVQLPYCRMQSVNRGPESETQEAFYRDVVRLASEAEDGGAVWEVTVTRREPWEHSARMAVEIISAGWDVRGMKLGKWWLSELRGAREPDVIDMVTQLSGAVKVK